MDDLKDTAFLSILSVLPERLKQHLVACEPSMRSTWTEIRIRAGMPIILQRAGDASFLTTSGKLTKLRKDNLLCPLQSEIDAIVQKACGYSIHSHVEELKNGYVTLPGGHRIGLCGTAVLDESGHLSGIRNIYGIHIRISNQMEGVSFELLQQCFLENTLKNLLIIGPPMSGKTVLLRDLCKQISNGALGKIYACTVVDERGELDIGAEGGAKNSLGLNTDVLTGYSKPDGITLAIRVLAPQIIFCDEIGSLEDANAILNGMLSGVRFIATAHAASFEEAFRKEGIQALVKAKMLDEIVLLGSQANLGKILSVQKVRDVLESNGPCLHSA